MTRYSIYKCYFKLADHIRNQDVYIERYGLPQKVISNIIEELEQIKRDRADEDGKVRIQSKRDIIAALNRSPDFSDALAMRAYFDLQEGFTGYLI